MSSSAASSFRHRMAPTPNSALSSEVAARLSAGSRFQVLLCATLTSDPPCPSRICSVPTNLNLDRAPLNEHHRRRIAKGAGTCVESISEPIDAVQDERDDRSWSAGGDLRDMFAEVPVSMLMTPNMASMPKEQSILRPSSAGPSGSPTQGSAEDRNMRLKRSHSMTLSSSNSSTTLTK